MRLIPLNGAGKGDFYPEKQICGDWENKVQVIVANFCRPGKRICDWFYHQSMLE